MCGVLTGPHLSLTASLTCLSLLRMSGKNSLIQCRLRKWLLYCRFLTRLISATNNITNNNNQHNVYSAVIMSAFARIHLVHMMNTAW